MHPPVVNFEDYSRLKRLVHGGKCLAFLGSGPSDPWFGDWAGLVRGLCEDLRVPCPETLTNDNTELLQELAQQARDKDLAAYKRYIHSKFARLTGVKEPRLHRCLLEARFQAYLTLNFDPLLYQAAQAPANKGCRKIFSYPQLNPGALRDGAIFHLHGLCLPGADTNLQDMKVVLSTEEFEEAYDPEKSLLPAVLENAFTVGRVCIIGSKLTDQALQNILSLCERRLEHLSPDHSDHLHYILLPSVVERKAGDQSSAEGAPGAAEETARQDVEKRYSRHRIQVVRYDKLDDSHLGLVRVIEDLADLRPPTMSGILEETDDEAYEIL